MTQETLEEVAHKMLDDYGIKSMGQSIGVLKVKKLMVKMAKWQQEQDRWKTVFEEIPPSNIELLAESPSGIIHLTDWRAGYGIFSCQAKSESSDGWKWKTI